MAEDTYTMHHASLIVSDLDRANHFYHNVLGMCYTERPDLGFPGTWFQIGAQQIHLLLLDNPDPTIGRPEHGGRDRHVALTVADLDPIQAILEQHEVKYTMSKSGRRAMFCRDPDGNAIEIIERAR